MKKILTLPHLPAFEAAARTESFSAAAKELCLTTGAVSRHIRNLESKLGGELFSRGHKEVRLTEQGKIFALACRKLLDELASAEKLFMEKTDCNQLTVNCLPTFAMHWLIPRLKNFHQACPHIHINVLTGTGGVVPGSDIAIRRDPAHFTGMDAIPFLREKSVLVSRPGYLQRCEAEHEGNTLVHIRIREDLWQKWSDGSLATPQNITHHLHLDHTFAAIQAAEDGLGIALVPLLFCEKQLSSGRLVNLNSYGCLQSGVYYVVVSAKETPLIQAFINWLKKQASPEPGETGQTGTTEPHTT
ncbi:LysR family transcriptional regulator [Klebsiella pneumoniae]|nr:LysR family transcriptional regulator [Klebsiella pneumoniae]